MQDSGGWESRGPWPAHFRVDSVQKQALRVISNTIPEEILAIGRQFIRWFWRKDRIQGKSVELNSFSL